MNSDKIFDLMKLKSSLMDLGDKIMKEIDDITLHINRAIAVEERKRLMGFDEHVELVIDGKNRVTSIKN